MNLADLSIKRPTFILALVTVIMVVGAISLSRLGVDQFPDVTFPVVSVLTPYRGAGPQEVETLVSKPMEEELSSISGIKHLSSTNQDGLSIITVEFTLGTDSKYAEQQVRDKVFSARAKLPRDVDEPILRRYDPADQSVLRLAFSADLTPAVIYKLAKDTVKTKLEQVPNVALVQITGGTEREIQVNLDRNKLKAHEVALTSVSQRIAANSQNVPVGKISQGSREVLFRTLGEYRSLDRIRDTAINFFGSDHSVKVSDIGTVVDTTQDVQAYGYFNGKPAVFIDIFRQSGSNTVQVVDNLMKQTTKLNQDFKTLPGAPSLIMVQDLARGIRWNIEDVRTAIFEGILLTILVVYFFLGSFRSTFITSFALPNSLLGAFILMYLMGFTINMVTLLALSLTVGLLIDDAIVVRENIWRHMAMGKPPKQAAIEGTKEVTMAVIATSITVISVFLPVGFLGGTIGQFFKQLGWTVVFAMAVSLFDSMTMAPLLSAYMASGKAKAKKGLGGFFETCCSPLHVAVQGFERFQEWLSTAYERVMRITLRHRLLILTAAFVFFIASLGLLPKIKKTFMPTQDIGYFQVTLEAAPGTSLESMRTSARTIENVIQRHPEVIKLALLAGNSDGESNVANYYVELVNYKKRKMDTSTFKETIRQELKPFAAVKPKVREVQMVGNRSPFTMYLVGDDLEKMSLAADTVIAGFSKIPGLADLDSNYRAGKPEYQILMDPARMEHLGVSAVTVGNELRGMVDGVVPAKFRDSDKEFDIRVRIQPDQRDLRQGLDSFFVPNMNSNLIRLSDVASPRATAGPLKISRRDRQRYIMISGELGVGGALGTIQDQATQIMKTIKLPEGVTYQFIGAAEDMKELFVNIAIAMLLAVMLIYLVLASLYESMVMPLLIMLALPLAMVGALGALYLFNQTLDIFSMIGLVMLLGLVAKNSILLVDYTIHLTRRGLPRREAVIQAGKIRLRPILMTTIALIAGMLPLALALTEISRMRQSMGIAIIGGLITSTLLTLLVVPACYEWADDFRLWLRKIFGRPALREIDMVEKAEEFLELETQTDPLPPTVASASKKPKR
jgi:HAE1 family hydrophobic/amphiphilic exporter-1